MAVPLLRARTMGSLMRRGSILPTAWKQQLPQKRNLLTSSACLNHSPDYYTVLGLNRSADANQVKRAYFAKAKKFHPDNNPSEEVRLMFQLVAEAYEVLSDEQKRKYFDEYGTAGSTFGGTAGGPKRPKDHNSYDAEELFNKIFGEAAQDEDMGTVGEDFAKSFLGEDSTKELSVELTFEEASLGTKHYVQITGKCVCPRCHGGKSEPGYTWQVCVFCEGTGIETEKIGHVQARKTCSYCDGTRKFNKWKCNECEGIGVVISTTDIEVNIPPGVEHGQVLKVHLPPALLQFTVNNERYIYVYVSVAKSDYFSRLDHDLVSEADMSPAQAILGGTLRIKGLHDPFVSVPIAPLTSSHSSVRLDGLGLRRSDGLRQGDHLVRLGLSVPKRLTRRQMNLWREFARLDPSVEDVHSGTVNGIEQSFGHKFETNVVECSGVQREFKRQEGKKREKRKGEAVTKGEPERNLLQRFVDGMFRPTTS